jgi:hypothetical protein
MCGCKAQRVLPKKDSDAKVFFIDVGDLSKEKEDALIKKVKKAYKKKGKEGDMK